MDITKLAENHAHQTQIDPPVTEDTIEERRARRMAALKKVAGIWADRLDIPADGLNYQRELRSEWH